MYVVTLHSPTPDVVRDFEITGEREGEGGREGGREAGGEGREWSDVGV